MITIQVQQFFSIISFTKLPSGHTDISKTESNIYELYFYILYLYLPHGYMIFRFDSLVSIAFHVVILYTCCRGLFVANDVSKFDIGVSFWFK